MEETNWKAQECKGGQVEGFGETGWNGVDWVQLVQDMDNWQALADIIMKLRVL